MIFAVSALLLLAAPSTPAPSRDDAASPQAAAATDNAEMARLFEADQAARTRVDFAKLDPAAAKAVMAADAERLKATRHLIETGALHTGKDFYGAAFVFQHGTAAEDYLLAHTLALAAASRGQAGARWIAAATLDRYLTKIGQPQIYGTQFHSADGHVWTQEPYQRTLMTDELRAALDVPPAAAQDKRLAAINAAHSR